MNTINIRAAVDRVSALFPQNIISRQMLRMEEDLTPNKSAYTFQVKQGNSSTDGPLENLLNQNDAFVLLALAIGIKKQDKTLDPPQYGNYQVFYFPNPNVFVGAPAGQATEASSLMCLYNGKLTFSTSSLLRMKPMDTSDFLMVPQDRDIDDGLAVQNLTNDAYVEFQPTLLLDGAQNNEFTLQLGDGDITGIDGKYTAAGAATATSRNIVVIKALGLNVANGSVAAKQLAGAWNY